MPRDGVDMPGTLRQLEDSYIDTALARTRGNKKAAADLLGLKRTTLVEKLRRRPRVLEVSDAGQATPWPYAKLRLLGRHDDPGPWAAAVRFASAPVQPETPRPSPWPSPRATSGSSPPPIPAPSSKPQTSDLSLVEAAKECAWAIRTLLSTDAVALLTVAEEDRVRRALTRMRDSLARIEEETPRAAERARTEESSMPYDHRKQSVYFSNRVLAEIEHEARRQRRSHSFLVNLAWQLSRDRIRAIPVIDDGLGPDERMGYPLRPNRGAVSLDDVYGEGSSGRVREKLAEVLAERLTGTPISPSGRREVSKTDRSLALARTTRRGR